MRLNFENNTEQIKRLASRAASAFVRRVGRKDLIEDATSDAMINIVDIDFDETFTDSQTESFICQKTFYCLLRHYQSNTGARLKRRVYFEELQDGAATSAEPHVLASLGLKETINKGLAALSRRDAQIVKLYLLYQKQSEVAKVAALSRSTVSRIVRKFADELRANVEAEP